MYAVGEDGDPWGQFLEFRNAHGHHFRGTSAQLQAPSYPSRGAYPFLRWERRPASAYGLLGINASDRSFSERHRERDLATKSGKGSLLMCKMLVTYGFTRFGIRRKYLVCLQNGLTCGRPDGSPPRQLFRRTRIYIPSTLYLTTSYTPTTLFEVH
jgi:hypothetical protein